MRRLNNLHLIGLPVLQVLEQRVTNTEDRVASIVTTQVTSFLFCAISSFYLLKACFSYGSRCLVRMRWLAASMQVATKTRDLLCVCFLFKGSCQRTGVLWNPIKSKFPVSKFQPPPLQE